VPLFSPLYSYSGLYVHNLTTMSQQLLGLEPSSRKPRPDDCELPYSSHFSVSNYQFQTCISSVLRQILVLMLSRDVLLPNSNWNLTTKSQSKPQSSAMLGTTDGSPPSFSLIEIDVCRRIELESRLVQILAPDGKEREMRKYSRTESQHLRLRRTKIKLSDFRTVKVIGKGAFGEVSKRRLALRVQVWNDASKRFGWCKRWIPARYMR
jgi:hypothetical protein